MTELKGGNGRRIIAGVTLLAVLLLLMWLGTRNPFPKHRFQQRKRESQLLVTQVDRGLRQYWLEYSRWPLPLTSETALSGLLRTDPQLTGVLLETAPGNPKKIKFLPDLCTTIRPDQSGLKLQPGGGFSLVDAWGEELYIMVDGGPDSGTSREGINPRVRVFSAGPDKDPWTWEDNLSSGQG